MIGVGQRVAAQDFALKTNAAGWAATTINAAFETGLGERTTLETGLYYNPWTFSHNKKIRHLFLQPEFRYWTCERFAGGFWGVHLLGGIFNAGGVKLPFGIIPALKKYRYQGWLIGGGVSYGYDWYLLPHLNLEATVGVGYLKVHHRRYECTRCGKKLNSGSEDYFGPTKLGISLVYLF